MRKTGANGSKKGVRPQRSVEPNAMSDRATRISDGHISEDVELRLYNAQGGRCFAPWCSVPMQEPGTESEGAKYHLDHYIPIAKGGLHCDWNLDLLCAECNLDKGAKWPSEWCKAKGWRYMPAPPLFVYACAELTPAEQFVQLVMDEFTEDGRTGVVTDLHLPPEICQSIAMVTNIAHEQARDEIMKWNTPTRVEEPAYIHAVRTRAAAERVMEWLNTQTINGANLPE